MFDQLDFKGVVAGGDRSVGGEDAFVFDVFNGIAVNGAGEVATAVLVEEFEDEEGGVAFIHVIFFDGNAELLEHSDAADAEDDFLAKAIPAVAPVEIGGEPAVVVGVFFQVGVEVVDVDGIAVDAAKDEFPGLNGDGAVFDLDGDFVREKFEEVLFVPVDWFVMLVVAVVKGLVEVAFFAKEGDGAEGDTEVGA